MSSISVIRHRLRQGLAAMVARPAAPNDGLADTWLSPDQRGLFRRMSAHDQAHARRVAHRLLAAGQTDRDLIAAALLHDVGKSGSARYPGRVRLPDRVARVILGRLAPLALSWLASDPDRPGGRGLFLAAHHARLGAEEATATGSSARTVWLIANHEDVTTGDPQLQALIAADDQSH